MKFEFDIPMNSRVLFASTISMLFGALVYALATSPSFYASASYALSFPVLLGCLVAAAYILKSDPIFARDSSAHSEDDVDLGFGRRFDVKTAGPELAPARTPIEWARDKGLDASSSDEAMTKAFADSLGPKWNDLSRCSLHVRSLVVLLAETRRDGGEAQERLRTGIAKAHATLRGPALEAALGALLNSRLEGLSLRRIVEQAESKHGYVSTLLMEMLVKARREDVLPTSEFLWLKEVDRGLYYALNNVGRRSYWAEAAAAVSHYDAEDRRGAALRTPNVETAVEALRLALIDQTA